MERAELHVVVWGGGNGTIEKYFTLNDHFVPIASPSGKGPIHYHRIEVPASQLREGANQIKLLSDTEHHGIEILLPGPALMVRTSN